MLVEGVVDAVGDVGRDGQVELVRAAHDTEAAVARLMVHQLSARDARWERED